MKHNWDFMGAHFTEWVKLFFGLIAVLIAINEFVIKNDEIKIAKINNGREFLTRGMDENIIDSLKSIMDHASNENLNEENRLDVLKDATPMHEYLISWSYCVANDICSRAASEDFLCQRLLGYEKIAEDLLTKVGMSYDTSKRDKIYSGMLSYCGNI